MTAIVTLAPGNPGKWQRGIPWAMVCIEIRVNIAMNASPEAEHEPECDQVAKKANGILACTTNSGQQDQGSDSSCVLCMVKLHLKCCLQLWAPRLRKDIEVLEHVHRLAAMLVKGLEHKSCEKWLRELGVFSLEKRRLGGDLIGLYSSLK
ncbi:hypothetical protein BTVI_142249 [Pitangus sulphuratus]|nr:hypothetical protein BTVI_142249 [Pitangus sulphuratus]